jgi:hypothetical protein
MAMRKQCLIDPDLKRACFHRWGWNPPLEKLLILIKICTLKLELMLFHRIFNQSNSIKIFYQQRIRIVFLIEPNTYPSERSAVNVSRSIIWMQKFTVFLSSIVRAFNRQCYYEAIRPEWLQKVVIVHDLFAWNIACLLTEHAGKAWISNICWRFFEAAVWRQIHLAPDKWRNENASWYPKNRCFRSKNSTHYMILTVEQNVLFHTAHDDAFEKDCLLGENKAA